MISLKDKTLFKQNCLINGKWEGFSHTINIHNPATEELLGTVPNFGKAETEKAILCAEEAFISWREKTAKERSVLLKKWYELILENIKDLAVILTSEQGKPLKEAEKEIQYGASFIEWFAEEAKRIDGDIISAPIKDHHILVIKQPIGVVGAITPWNFPCAMITRKCAPALAAGCTVVLKPSSLTPFTALALGELAIRAGIPNGVINIITGNATAIGGALTKSPLVRKISFTGSTETGKILAEQSASTIKKLSLELGGNAPFIIFDDADIDAAIKGVIASKFRNTGQTCVCANRIFIQDNIYDVFANKLSEEVKKLKLGNGLEENTEQGPLINESAVQKVEAHIQDAINKGAKIVCGGKRSHLGKTFFEPTVLTEVTPNTLIFSEETFGPVAALFRFHHENEAIQMANDTVYGLASYFYSQNISRVWRVSEKLEYGMVGINSGMISTEVAPFGGIKESGIGREGSKYGIDEFVQVKTLYMGGE
jgi:succinate-semialdehyde dehydrogenase/glutarate-semialdehyde dehydrogenase